MVLRSGSRRPPSVESIDDLEGGGILQAVLAFVVEAGGGDVGVAEPILDFGDVGPVFEGVSGGGGAEAVGAEVFHGDAERARVGQDDVAVNGLAAEGGAEFSVGALDRLEERPGGVGCATGGGR